jgi:hypothetical protein
MKRELDPHLHSLRDSLNTAIASSSNMGNAKMCWEEDVQQQDGVLGYQV